VRQILAHQRRTVGSRNRRGLRSGQRARGTIADRTIHTPEDMRAYALLAYFSADPDQAGRTTKIDDGDSIAMPAARLVQAILERCCEISRPLR
jgi:hypothetical protein